MSPVELESTYRYLTFFNRIGGGRAIRNELRRLSRGWTGPIRILDLASGGADIPRMIARWAQRAGKQVSIVCLDRSPQATALARRNSKDFPSISFVIGDALAMPFPKGSFDYVTSCLFLHHLSNEDAVRLLRGIDEVAVRGLVIADLIRRRRAVMWAWLLTLGCAVVHYDGPLSVKRAFTLPEIEDVVAQAGIRHARIRPVLGHHFLLSGERPQVHLQSDR
jgi:SAM-dependent methyltransferase